MPVGVVGVVPVEAVLVEPVTLGDEVPVAAKVLDPPYDVTSAEKLAPMPEAPSLATVEPIEAAAVGLVAAIVTAA